MTHVTTKYLMNRRDKYHDFYWFLALFPWTSSPLRGSSYSLQTDRQNDCARCVGRMIFPPLLAFPLIRAGKRISSTRRDPDTSYHRISSRFASTVTGLCLHNYIPYFLARHSAAGHTTHLWPSVGDALGQLRDRRRAAQTIWAVWTFWTCWTSCQTQQSWTSRLVCHDIHDGFP